MTQRRGRTGGPPCAGAARHAKPAKPLSPCRRSLNLGPTALVPMDPATARAALEVLQDIWLAYSQREATDTTGEQ